MTPLLKTIFFRIGFVCLVAFIGLGSYLVKRDLDILKDQATMSNKALAAVNSKLADVSSKTKVIEGFQGTPTLSGLKLTSISGKTIKYMPYSIVFSEDLDSLMKLHAGRNTINLVYPEYKVGEELFQFHPYQWSINLIALAEYGRKNGISAIQPAVESLILQSEPFARDVDGAVYYTYPVKRNLYGKTLEANWTSAFSQGFALAAWVKLFSVTQDRKHLDMAKRVLRSFLQIREEPGQSRPWVAFVDKSQYLWFEEYPNAKDPQIRVLNGHIWALQGLYSYYRIEPSDEVLGLLRAGITTVQRYASSFRIPGEVNRYCLLSQAPDYSSQRSVKHQEWLLNITSEPFFRETMHTFQTDMAF